MPSFHLHLRNVPPEADSQDIRGFFHPFDIPDGGVQIVGGPEGNVFVTFSTYEDLMQGTSYHQRYLMGNQVFINLIDGNDIKYVVENMMHELGVQGSAMEISAAPHMFYSRALHAATGSSAEDAFMTPSGSSDFSHSPWSNRRHAADEYDSMYAGREAKKMRLSEEGGYASGWASISGQRDSTGRKEKIASQLELELKMAQHIKDQLEKKKERIENLKKGLLDDDDIDSAPIKDPFSFEERRKSGMIDPSADWEGGQSQPPVYHSYREKDNLLQEPHLDLPWRSMEEPPYKRAHTSLDEPLYESLGWFEPRFRDRGRSPPQQIRDPFISSRSEDTYDDRRKRYRDDDRRARSGVPGLLDLKLTKVAASDVGAYYLQLNSLPPFTTACTVWSWFGGASGPCPSVTVTSNTDAREEVREAFVAFRDMKSRDAKMRTYDEAKGLGRKEALVCIARACLNPDMDIFTSTETGVDHMMNKEQKLALTKEWYPQGLLKKPVSSTPLAAKRMPNVDDTKATLYYMTLRNLAKNATAMSVWGRFGGPLGQSVGVLLFDMKGPEAEKIAFVAYDNFHDRNVELQKTSKGKTTSDATVYGQCADGPPGSKVFKTTPKGDAELSKKEYALLDREFFMKTYTKREKSKKEKEEQRRVLNKISRAFFYDDVSQGKRQLKSQSGRKSDPQGPMKKPVLPNVDNSKATLYFMTLIDLAEDDTATSVWERFGGPLGESVGVLLFDMKGPEAAKVAFVAYDSFHDRNAELQKTSQGKTTSDATVYGQCSDGPPGSKVFKTTPKGDVELSKKEYALLDREFFMKTYTKREKTRKEKEEQRRVLNKISRALFYDLDKHQSKSQSTRESERKNGPQPNQICYLRMEIRNQKKVTACKVWSWFDGQTGPCPSVILIKAGKQKTMHTAFVAFRDSKSRNTENRKRRNSKGMSEQEALLKVAHLCDDPDVSIFKSTDNGTDEMMNKEEIEAFTTKSKTNEVKTEDEIEASKTKSGFKSAEKAPCILQIQGISKHTTVGKVWSWFRGKKGSAQGVTSMMDGETKIAFVRFTDPENCDKEQSKYENSKIVSETEMLRKLASCPPELKIYKSSPKGDQNMSLKERAALKERVKKAEEKEIEYGKKVEQSDLASEGKGKLMTFEPDVEGHVDTTSKDIDEILESTQEDDVMTEDTTVTYTSEVTDVSVPERKDREEMLECMKEEEDDVMTEDTSEEILKSGKGEEADDKSEDTSGVQSSLWEPELMEDAPLGDLVSE